MMNRVTRVARMCQRQGYATFRQTVVMRSEVDNAEKEREERYAREHDMELLKKLAEKRRAVVKAEEIKYDIEKKKQALLDEITDIKGRLTKQQQQQEKSKDE
ncbi:hypothetical protein AKO1_002966 [Acrasis kona]|uniref:Uncharacterized protein n=1 Tax=Acrasis kona TaxID=1008807 RepID=A0AAW2Z6E2_9EUKA